MHSFARKVDKSAFDRNLLLAAFPGDTRERWLPKLEWVDMSLGQVLHEPNERLTHVYFPVTAVVSLLHILEDGATSEVAVVGNMGVVGLTGVMGGGLTLNQAAVQIAGQGLRLPISVFRSEVERAGPAFNLVLRYTAALFAQICQTSVCNLHHSLDQRLCRWLLLALDRLPADEFLVTQERIASLLGVRRAGVNESATKLQREGILRYARGRMTVLDRRGLEQRCCECYGIVRAEYERLLPNTREGGQEGSGPPTLEAELEPMLRGSGWR